MAELTHFGRAMLHQAAAQAALEAAMQTKPDEQHRAVYSRWIKAHEHMLAAAKLLDLDTVEEINMRDWEVRELSFGCSHHDSPMCTLLVNKLDGRQLHIPATDVKVEPNG